MFGPGSPSSFVPPATSGTSCVFWHVEFDIIAAAKDGDGVERGVGWISGSFEVAVWQTLFMDLWTPVVEVSPLWGSLLCCTPHHTHGTG